MFHPIHKHVLYKLKVKEILTDDYDAKELLTAIVKAIGMKPVTEPQAFNVRDDGNEGYTGSINLSTSHIAYHLWDNKKLLMLDVYSCKDFDEDIPLEVIDYRLGLRSGVYLIVDRETFKVVDSQRFTVSRGDDDE